MMRIWFVLSLGLLASGCATITRGTSEQVQILSEPAGASARTSMGHSCTTPCTLQLQRRDEFTVAISKPGYIEQQVQVTTRVGGGGAAGFVGNVVIGGVVGMAADAASGATLEHFPNPVSVTLEPVAGAPPPRRGPPRPAKKKSEPST